MNKPHTEECRDLAKNFQPQHSVVYARDHIRALLETRLVVKPEGMIDWKWGAYKEQTAALNALEDHVSEICRQLAPDHD